jgi:hypothetical protein
MSTCHKPKFAPRRTTAPGHGARSSRKAITARAAAFICAATCRPVFRSRHSAVAYVGEHGQGHDGRDFRQQAQWPFSVRMGQECLSRNNTAHRRRLALVSAAIAKGEVDFPFCGRGSSSTSRTRANRKSSRCRAARLCTTCHGGRCWWKHHAVSAPKGQAASRCWPRSAAPRLCSATSLPNRPSSTGHKLDTEFAIVG